MGIGAEGEKGRRGGSVGGTFAERDAWNYRSSLKIFKSRFGACSPIFFFFLFSFKRGFCFLIMRKQKSFFDFEKGKHNKKVCVYIGGLKKILGFFFFK